MSDESVEPATHLTVMPNVSRVLFLAGILMFIGALTPWVSVLFFSISGVTAGYGYAPLLGGILAVVVALQIWRGSILPSSRTGLVVVIALIASFLSLVLASYVAIEAKRSIAESEAEQTTQPTSEPTPDPFGLDSLLGNQENQVTEFERSMSEAFAPRLGMGLWLSIAGGLLGIVGTIAHLRSGSRTSPGAPGPPPTET